MKVSEFYKQEFVDFASYSTIRMIGSAIDGMKNVHRKIINTVIDKNIKTEIKVSQLNSKVAEYTEYLHGDSSSTISGMAQNFAGTNNVPLLAAEGNFGNRFKNEPSAPRYIFTYGLPILFDLINSDDNEILDKQFFEGTQIEPRFYVPELPLLLINGSNGIASGFKQTLLPRNPSDILKYLRGFLSGKIKTKVFDDKPWFNGFNGTVEHGENSRQWKIKGVFERTNTSTVTITEIPVGIELPKYIEVLNELREANKIKSFKDMSDKNTFKFVIKFERVVLEPLTDDDLMEMLKLIKTETEVYVAIDENMKVKTFESVGEIFLYYIEVKAKYLKKRKEYIIKKLDDEIQLDNSKYHFIKMIVDDKLVVNKRSADDISKDLDKVEHIIKVNDSYSYLLNMSIGSLTKEKLDSLSNSIITKKEEMKTIKSKTINEIWLEDISKLKF